MRVRTYIGLGSNLAGPVQQVRRALVELSHLPGSRLVRHSRLYRNPAMVLEHTGQQPEYVNAVAALETGLPPGTLLRLLHQLEHRHQRVRKGVWGPRTLDLDLLLYGHLRLQRRTLLLPHPGMYQRAFVVYPLRELNPHGVIPGRGSLVRCMAHLNPRTLCPVPPWRRRFPFG